MKGLIEELRQRRAAARLGGGEKALQKQQARGKMTARDRIDFLLDEGTFVELDTFATTRCTDFGMDQRRTPGDGVVTGSGRIEGNLVYLASQDFSAMGGSLGEMHAEKICRAMDLAVKCGCPFLQINDSGGARIQEGISSLAGYAKIFLRNTPRLRRHPPDHHRPGTLRRGRGLLPRHHRFHLHGRGDEPDVHNRP